MQGCGARYYTSAELSFQVLDQQTNVPVPVLVGERYGAMPLTVANAQGNVKVDALYETRWFEGVDMGAATWRKYILSHPDYNSYELNCQTFQYYPDCSIVGLQALDNKKKELYLQWKGTREYTLYPCKPIQAIGTAAVMKKTFDNDELYISIDFKLDETIKQKFKNPFITKAFKHRNIEMRVTPEAIEISHCDNNLYECVQQIPLGTQHNALLHLNDGACEPQVQIMGKLILNEEI